MIFSSHSVEIKIFYPLELDGLTLHCFEFIPPIARESPAFWGTEIA